MGEAPGDEELRKGQPFVGPAGRVFNGLLRTAGLDRADYHIANVFSNKLPSNEVANWCMSLTEARAMDGGTALPAIGSKGFLRPEHRHHLDRLAAELAEVQPTMIVPLGATALWALTGSPQITAYRGTVMLATHLAPGVKILPTFHPMAVQHQWKLYPVVVGDFLKAQVEAQRGPTITLPKRELLLEPNLQDLFDYDTRIQNSTLLSVDIETGWDQITCIGFAPDPEHAICVPFWDLRNPNRSYWLHPSEEAQAWRMVERWLQTPVAKVGQNYGAYDMFWNLKKNHLATRNYHDDTRLIHHALYPELPKDLGFLGASYASQGAWKHWGHTARQGKRDDA